jgi:nicotinamidase/pyrazinamidase
MTVFFDIDTQIDFMFPAGALYVPGAEQILPAIAKLNHFAEAHAIPLISTADAHPEDDPEFLNWPAHCVAGTIGQKKPQSTRLANRAVIPNKLVKSLPTAPQTILQKVVLNAFSNPNLPTLLDTLAADRYVVYGVVTEICVRHAAWGLLERGGARVEIVTDAVRSLNQPEADAMLAEFTAAGGHLTTTAEVCG